MIRFTYDIKVETNEGVVMEGQCEMGFQYPDVKDCKCLDEIARRTIIEEIGGKGGRVISLKPSDN